jgi:hypothetical protein
VLEIQGLSAHSAAMPVGNGLPGDYFDLRHKYQLRRQNHTIAGRDSKRQRSYVLYLDKNAPAYKCLGYVFNGAALKQPRYGIAFIQAYSTTRSRIAKYDDSSIAYYGMSSSGLDSTMIVECGHGHNTTNNG